MRKNCLTCGKEMKKGRYSQKYWNTRKYCSLKCRPKQIFTESRKKDISMRMLGNKVHVGMKHTKETRVKQSMSAGRDKNHHSWIGDKVGYSALHAWVRNHLGTPNYCAYCQNINKSPRSYNWANISRTYRRDLSDWVRLCGKCHKAYDMGKINLCNQQK